MGTKEKQLLVSVRCILLMIILQIVGQYRLVCEGVGSYQKHSIPTYGGNPPMKTIKHSNGDVVDCVDFYDQPAFDHPLLKEQKIKAKLAVKRGNPASTAGRVVHHDQVQRNTQKICPEGTVPILRQAMERSSNATPGGSLKHAFPSLVSTARPTGKAEDLSAMHALYWAEYQRIENISATINLWNPSVGENESSMMYIAASNLSNGAVIAVGWMVNKPLFGDDKTRLFVSWSDGAKGCYNLVCPGFVQTSTTTSLGSTLHPVSEFGGQSYEDDFALHTSENGDWWASFHGIQLGYFPAAVIPSLTGQYGVTAGAFGGTVNLDPDVGPVHPSEMGSGAFPFEGVHRACYLRNLYFAGFHALKMEWLQPKISCPDCYDVKLTNEGAPFGKAGESIILVGGTGLAALASPPRPN